MEYDLSEIWDNLYYGAFAIGLVFNGLEIYEAKKEVIDEMFANGALDASGHQGLLESYQFILCSELITSEGVLNQVKVNIAALSDVYHGPDFISVPSDYVATISSLMNEIASGIRAFEEIYEQYDFSCDINYSNLIEDFQTSPDDVLDRFNFIYSDLD